MGWRDLPPEADKSVLSGDNRTLEHQFGWNDQLMCSMEGNPLARLAEKVVGMHTRAAIPAQKNTASSVHLLSLSSLHLEVSVFQVH